MWKIQDRQTYYYDNSWNVYEITVKNFFFFFFGNFIMHALACALKQTKSLDSSFDSGALDHKLSEISVNYVSNGT